MKEINKYLTEAMGVCWHEWPNSSTPCIKCGQRSNMSDIGMHNNFLTWEGFGKLWQWANEQEWIGEFIYWYNSNMVIDEERLHTILSDLVDPEFFAKAVVEFLQEK